MAAHQAGHLANVTAPGTLEFAAISDGSPSIKATTLANSYPNATGFSAVKVVTPA
jgi:hypothetical protein